MASALKRFYKGDNSVSPEREIEIFHSCNDKIGKLLRWSNTNEDSISELRQLALSQGGLFNASIRQQSWPAILDIQSETTVTTHSEPCEDLDIIRKDVQRSALFRCEAVAGSIVKGEQQSEVLQNKLVSVLCSVVATPLGDSKDKPCYYQGLHDIAFVLMFNLGYDEDKSAAVLRNIMESHLQDATRKDFSNVTFVLDSVLMPLLYTLDVEVYQALAESDVPLTNAILPWLITLYAHSVQDAAVASRLMDAFIANPHPLLPFYVAVALLTHPSLRQQILAAIYDPVMMHMAIHGLPGQLKNDFVSGSSADEVVVTAQEIIDSALKIMHQHPPQSLLRFIGVGLQKRARRRVLNKARRISMLHIPAKQSSFQLHAELFLRTQAQLRKDAEIHLEHAMSRATVLYGTALKKGEQAITLSKQSLMALQIIVLFICMPQQYVAQFYYLVQAAMEFCRTDRAVMAYMGSLRVASASGAKDIEGPTVTMSSLTNKNQIASLYDGAGADNDDVPGMVNSISMLSLSELDDSSHHQRHQNTAGLDFV